MKYALNVNEDGRILSSTFEKYATENMPLVDDLPNGNIADYLYLGGEYIYDPIPEPEMPKEPTTDTVLNTLLGVTE